MPNNKVWNWDDNENSRRPNSTLWEFSITPFSKDEEAAKARVQEVRNQMTIDKIGEKVKGWINPENMMLWEFSITPPDIDPSFKRLNLNATVSPFSQWVEEGKELRKKLGEIDETR